MDLTLAIADRVVDNRAGVQGKERSLTLTGADIGVRATVISSSVPSNINGTAYSHVSTLLQFPMR
jgi:hypothetical protein